MSDELDDLLSNNRRWAEAINQRQPGFFTRLAQQQTPQYMWIGCADSRVPANEITGLDPGEVFVHRNVANVVVHSDLNALSTIQFAVEHLKVKHIIVVGHYGCAGVRAAMRGLPALMGQGSFWVGILKGASSSAMPGFRRLKWGSFGNRPCSIESRTLISPITAAAALVWPIWDFAVPSTQ